MTREIIPDRKTEGSTVSSIDCDRSSLIAIFVLKRDVKLQLTNWWMLCCSLSMTRKNFAGKLRLPLGIFTASGMFYHLRHKSLVYWFGVSHVLCNFYVNISVTSIQSMIFLISLVLPSGEVLAWLSVCSEAQMICIWSSWCHWHPIVSCTCVNIFSGVSFLSHHIVVWLGYLVYFCVFVCMVTDFSAVEKDSSVETSHACSTTDRDELLPFWWTLP